MADEIVAVYRAEVEQYKKAVDELVGKVNKLDKEQGVASKSSEQMGAVMKKVGGIIAAAFTVDRIVAFGREAVKLAAQAEGVERAFRRVGSPQLLEGLRRATRGTVSDLQLMQNAVKASNFDIPLKNLASLFAFAQARARETGESVDYLVDSIILGIGRKSPLILDNLGISAVQLREKFKGLGAEQQTVGDVAQAVGEIADEAMRKMGEQADTAADKIASLEAAFVNLKTEAGKSIIGLANAILPDERSFEAQVKGTWAYARAISQAGDILRSENEIAVAAYEKRADKEALLAELAAKREIQAAELTVKLERLKSKEVILAEDTKQHLLQSAIDRAVGFDLWKRGEAKKRMSEFLEEKKERITQIGIIEEQIRTIELLNKKQSGGSEPVKEQIRNVFFLTKAIKTLREELEAEGTTRERIAQILKEIPPLQEELARLLGEETEASKKAREEVEKLAKAEEDRWAALEKIEDDRLQKRLSIDKYIADRTAQGLKDELDAALKNEELLAANAILDAENSIMNEESKAEKIKEINDAMTSEQLRLMNEYHTKLQALEDAGVQAVKDAEEEKKKARQQTINQGLSDFNEYAQGVQSLVNGIVNASAQAYQWELQQLDYSLQQGQISREHYDQRRREMMEDNARQQRDLALFNAIINTAVAVTSALMQGPPQGYILAALSAALGAVEIATITAQPIPQFAEGVIGLQGAGTETSDSIPAFLSRGESVMTAAETKKYRPLLEGIRKGTLDRIIQDTYVRPAVDAALLNGFADIGKSAQLNASFNDMNLLRAIDRHRESDKDGFKFLASELSKHMRTPKRGGYA